MISLGIFFMFFHLESLALCYLRVKREDVSETVKGLINVPLPPPRAFWLQNLSLHLARSHGDSLQGMLNCAVTETRTR